MPASISSLPPDDERNLDDSPVNQSDQKGFVSWRLVRHSHGPSDGFVGSMRSGGTDTLAEVVLRIVRERVCHSMPEARDGKDVGRVMRYCSIDCRASMADPSTTSSTPKPRSEVPRRAL